EMLKYRALSEPSEAVDPPETRRSAEGAALYARENDEHDFSQRLCWLLDRPDECDWMKLVNFDALAGSTAAARGLHPGDARVLRSRAKSGVRPLVLWRCAAGCAGRVRRSRCAGSTRTAAPSVAPPGRGGGLARDG